MRSALTIATSLCAALLSAANAFADAGSATPAGSWIPNTANVEYSVDGAKMFVDSNIATVQVAEIVAFNLHVIDGAKTGVKAGEEYEFAFDLTNTGNGSECFSVTPVDASQGELDIVALQLHSDDDADGELSVGDGRLNFSECAVQLEPGQTKRLFIDGRMPQGVEAATASLSIIVRPSQGLGEVGKVYAHAGDDQSDAMSGSDPDSGYVAFRAQGSSIRVNLSKSAVVAGNASLADAVPGETIAYTLLFTGEGEGSVSNAVIADPLPATLIYVPGSLKLDGVALTDGADADAGSFDAGLVSVAVGDRTAPFNTVITFEAVVLDPTQLSSLN